MPSAPRTPIAPNRILETRSGLRAALSPPGAENRASTSSRNCSNSSRVTVAANSTRCTPAFASRVPHSHSFISRSAT